MQWPYTFNRKYILSMAVWENISAFLGSLCWLSTNRLSSVTVVHFFVLIKDLKKKSFIFFLFLFHVYSTVFSVIPNVFNDNNKKSIFFCFHSATTTTTMTTITTTKTTAPPNTELVHRAAIAIWSNTRHFGPPPLLFRSEA